MILECKCKKIINEVFFKIDAYLVNLKRKAKKSFYMPKIFEYFGILIFFYSNEHEPIHVHAKKGEFESKAEFYIVDGIISEIKITNSTGSLPLKGKDLKDFETFLEAFGEEIVKKWINYFVYHKDVQFEKITKRLK